MDNNGSKTLKKAALPPKLRYRIRKWLQQISGSSNVSPEKVREIITEKFEQALALKSLKKNQVMASLYKNGSVRLDFGQNVSDKAKQAALEWAKKKGLKIESDELAKSLNKSSVTLGETKLVKCVDRIVWDF